MVTRSGGLSTAEKIASLNPAQRRAGRKELAQQAPSTAQKTVEKAKQITTRGFRSTVSRPKVITAETKEVLEAKKREFPVVPKKAEETLTVQSGRPQVAPPTPLTQVSPTARAPTVFSTITAAPEPTTFLERIQKRGKKEEFKLLTEKSSLKRQKAGLTAFGLGVATVPVALVTQPIKTIKGFAQTIRHPVRSVRIIGTELRKRPASTTGELVGSAAITAGISKGVGALAKPVKSRLLGVELEGATAQTGRVVTTQKGQVVETIGEFTGKGKTFFEVGLGKRKVRLREKPVTDVKSKVEVAGTRERFSVDAQLQFKQKGKVSEFVGTGEGLTSGQKTAELFELAGGVKGARKQTLIKGVRGFEAKLVGEQDPLIIKQPVGEVIKTTVSAEQQFRITGVSKTILEKPFKARKGFKPEVVLAPLESQLETALTKRGRITTVSDIGKFKGVFEEPITFKQKVQDVVPVETPGGVKLEKVGLEFDVALGGTSLERFRRAGFSFAETIPRAEKARTPQLEKLLRTFVPKKVRLQTGQFLGVGTGGPTVEIPLPTKLKPSTSFKRFTGLQARETARLGIRAGRLAETSKPLVTPLSLPKGIQPLDLTPRISPGIKPVLSSELKPSLKPSLRPQLKPGLQPALQPALKPQIRPLLIPTLKPVLKPQLQPSLKPGVFPSVPVTSRPLVSPLTQPLKIGRRTKPTRKLKLQRELRFQPSVVGVELGLKEKKGKKLEKKVLTGLEVRGIPI